MEVRNVFGYGRASTDHQVLSTEQQELLVKEAFALYQKTRPGWENASWVGFFADEDTCRLTKFREREQGSQILAVAGEGDVILAAKFDRMFANVIDVCEMFEMVEYKGISFRPLDLDIPLDTNLGRAVFKIMACIKELEVQEIRARIKNAFKSIKASGRPTNGTERCIGWRTVAVADGNAMSKRRWYFVPDQTSRRIANYLLKLHVEKGMGQRKLMKFLHQNPVDLGDGMRISVNNQQVGKWLKAAKNGFPLPNGSHVAAPIPHDAVILEPQPSGYAAPLLD